MQLQAISKPCFIVCVVLLALTTLARGAGESHRWLLFVRGVHSLCVTRITAISRELLPGPAKRNLGENRHGSDKLVLSTPVR